MGTPIKLIVGLGNPGPNYESTRHNAGAWFVHALCQHFKLTLKPDSKFQCQIAKLTMNEHDCFILIPSSYMNVSGQSVSLVQKFYKITPHETLIAHDELDLPPGVARLKLDGGHGGHNGLKDIFSRTNSKQFYRLRIGIGHPGHRDDVTDYVLTKPSVSDKEKILNIIDYTLPLMTEVILGNIDKSMQQLHTFAKVPPL